MFGLQIFSLSQGPRPPSQISFRMPSVNMVRCCGAGLGLSLSPRLWLEGESQLEQNPREDRALFRTGVNAVGGSRRESSQGDLEKRGRASGKWILSLTEWEGLAGEREEKGNSWDDPSCFCAGRLAGSLTLTVVP